MVHAPVSRLPGAPASMLYRRALAAFLTWVADAALGLVADWVRQQLQGERGYGVATAIGVVFLIGWLVVGLGMIVILILAYRKRRAEITSGYSTLLYEDAEVDIWDVSTGHIIRRSSEPPLKGRAAVEAARARAIAGGR